MTDNEIARKIGAAATALFDAIDEAMASGLECQGTFDAGAVNYAHRIDQKDTIKRVQFEIVRKCRA